MLIREEVGSVSIQSLHIPLLAAFISFVMASLACAFPASELISPSPTFTTATSAPAATPEEPTVTPIESTPIRPPLAGQIVYTCQLFADGLYDQICVMEPDGSFQQRLTTNDLADHFYPTLSPDGSSILFSANLEGPYEIYEQPIGGVPIRLTVQGHNYAPAPSPDGSLVAYTHTDAQGSALWLMQRSGDQPQWLIGEAWDASWSPDGAWILHASDRSGTIQLWRVRPDGTDLQRVTDLTGLRGRNDWSSQGLLATYAGPSWGREIYAFDIEGQSLRQLTDGGNNLAPSFSPDGDWITYTSYVDNYLDENGCEIYVQHIETGTRYRLTENSFCDWQPRWGPEINEQ
ncbi:MAG: TolB family protein [Anaerolineales bacterium]